MAHERSHWLESLRTELWSARWIFLATLALYVAIFSRRVLLDITAQVQTITKVCAGTVALPPTFMFYGATWLTALGQCNFTLLMGAAALVCAGFITAKWWISKKILIQVLVLEDKQEIRKAAWLAAMLGLVSSLPTADWPRYGFYLSGAPTPNYWMNGTLLASWPFALMLFWESAQQLARPQAHWVWRMLLWILLLLVSKPSYLFVFALVYPPMLLIGHGWRNRAAWIQFAGLAAAASLLLLEYWLVFRQPDSVYVREFNKGQSSGVVLAPFFVWRHYTGNIALAVLSAIVFPLSVLLGWWHLALKNLLLRYAWAGFGVALLISAAFMQTGAEYLAWNFRWQHYLASYILFLSSAAFAWQQWRAQAYRMDLKIKWISAIFALHLLSGVVYLGKMWWTKLYY